MAKNRHNHEDHEASAEHEIAHESAHEEVASIVIQGITFQVPKRYTEGHVMSAAEASTLNQTLAENLRNNFARKVKTVKGEGDVTIDEATHTMLQQELNAYAQSYTFYSGSRSPRLVDPLEKEVRLEGEKVILQALNARGLSRSKVTPESFKSLVDNVISVDPSIRERARANVEARAAAGADLLSGLEIKSVQAEGQPLAEAAE